MERTLYSYEYVNVPFDAVIRLLADHPDRILGSATDEAATHADEVVRSLSARVAGVEVSHDTRIIVERFVPTGARSGVLPLRWRSARAEALFPAMEAGLEVAAVSLHPPLTQVSLIGRYRPPLGIAGWAGDALVGHRIAEVAVRRFVRGVAATIEAVFAGTPLSNIA